MILLDTNAFLWLGSGDTRLGIQSRATIEEARDKGGIGVCAIAAWEISMLAERKRISLATDTLNWVETALTKANIRVVPLSPTIAVDAGRLPGKIHGDPADRLTIATARFLGCPLLTSDRRILDYARGGHVQAIDARG